MTWGNSIQVDNSGSGNGNGYRLRSHICLFSRSKSGRIEGRGIARVADPIVKAIIGTDTATAIPEDDGEFKIVGLRAGTYQLLIDGQNNFRDTLIGNVIVRNNEDTLCTYCHPQAIRFFATCDQPAAATQFIPAGSNVPQASFRK